MLIAGALARKVKNKVIQKVKQKVKRVKDTPGRAKNNLKSAAKFENAIWNRGKKEEEEKKKPWEQNMIRSGNGLNSNGRYDGQTGAF